MAQGTVGIFDQFMVDVGEEIHDLENDAFYVALTTGITTPVNTLADPRWGAGGGTNLSTEQVATGGNYALGGNAIANPAYTLTGGLAMWDADDPATWASHPSNPTNARWGIIYNNTAAGKQCVGWIDLGSTFNMTTGPLSISFHANGIFRIDQA